MGKVAYFFRRCVLWLVITVFLGFFVPRQAFAVEGGVGHYIQGGYGDFLMGFPQTGFSVRNDFIYQTGYIDGVFKGGQLHADLDMSAFINITKVSYIFDVPSMNGVLGFGLGVPVFINLNLSGDASATIMSQSNPGGTPIPQQVNYTNSGNRGGLSDIFIMPIIAGWNFDEVHLAVMPIVFLPTGYYDSNRLTSLGKNYFSFDGNVAFTWLSKSNFELSINAGYMKNTENPSTHYLSGNLLHADWTAAYHFTPRFGLGATGYLVTQTTPDSGSGAKFGDFACLGSGIGPIATLSVPVGDENLTIIAKWIHDLGSQHSFMTDTFYASLAITF